MNQTWNHRFLSFLAIAAFALHAAASEPSVTITIPNKTNPNFEIAVAKVTVLVTSESAVTFTITHGGGSVMTNALLAGSNDCFPGALPAGVFDLPPCGIEYSAGPSGLTNSINVVPPSGGASGPDRRKYTFVIYLDGNINRANSCAGFLNADDVWTIAAAGPAIE